MQSKRNGRIFACLSMVQLILLVPAAMGAQVSAFIGDGDIADLAIETSESASLLYLARKPTNTPFAGAKVSLQLSGQEKTVPFEETPAPGVYKLAGAAPSFDKSQIVIEAGEDSDLIDVAAVDPKAGAVSASNSIKAPTEHRVAPLVSMFLLGVVVSAAGYFVVSRLRLKRASRSTVALGWVLVGLAAGTTLSPGRASAHGGHEHGEAPAEDSSQVGATIGISKKAQFLIGLTTVPAEVKDIPDSFVSYGHIVAKPQQDTYILAPQAGYLRGSQSLVLGQKVSKGQSLAAIESVGRINLTAPISGQILEIAIAEGSRIEAGAKLFRITDPSTVWVDAELYENDLARFGDVTSATVGTGSDDQSFPAKILNFMTPISEETRTAKGFLELANNEGKLRLGSFVTIHFALASQSKGIILPSAAVVTRGGEEILFVQIGPESFEARNIVTKKGPEPGTLIVTSGVKDSERVVVSGSYQLLMKAR